MSLSSNNFQRLTDFQVSAVAQTDAQIKQWEQYKSDYEQLQNQLNVLPERLNYDVMVPLCSVAFVPGRLVHTNEVLVLLGDNWFVDRSAKQAAEMVQRRAQKISESLDELRSQKKLLLDQFNFTGKLQEETRGDFVELREDYSEEKESSWREVHRRNVQKQLQQERRAADAVGSALWERLEELEAQELHNNEISREEMSQPPERRVGWEVDESSSEEDEVPTIHFTHTPTLSADLSKERSDVASGDATSIPRSPADIYRLVREEAINQRVDKRLSPVAAAQRTDVPRSILRKPTDFIELDRARAEREREICDSPSFHSSIITAVETEVHERCATTSRLGNTQSQPQKQQDESVKPGEAKTKPVSRFKARRKQIAE